MVIREEYDIAYMLYYESKQFEEIMSVIELKQMTITESTDLEAINEAFGDIVRGYMNKVMSGIQKVWDKLKQRVQYLSRDMLLKKWKEEDIRKAIQATDVEPVNMDNFRDFNLERLTGVQLRELNYDTMKGSLDSVESFLKAQYGSFYKDDSKNVKENLRDFITMKKVDNYNVTPQDLQKMVEFVLKGESQLVEDINKNIEAMNRSADAVSNLIRNVENNPTNESVMTLESTMQYYFLEDGEDDKMKINTSKEGEENKPDPSKEIKDAVTTYMKASTQVLSAQMSLSTEILSIYTKVISLHMKKWSKTKKETKPTENTNPDNSPNNGQIQKIK